ncbi:MAG TPA: fructose-6-phosphate aldolase [Planctomycetes bacterium]|nr:fructose-6-phosphate aldolase [Planctomycetota bacterium]
MQLFIDSTDPEEILQAREWGIVEGVTTNPTLFGLAGGDVTAVLRGVVDAAPGPVLCQVIGWHDLEPLKAQARWLHRFSEKIVVKLPMCSAGLQALRSLKQEDPAMPIAVTAVASIAQAYLAAKCGADIVALFNGPLDQVLDQEVEIVAPIKKIFSNYGLEAKILSCGRLPRAFGRFAEEGTDICTFRFEYLKLLYEHPYTDKRMTGFLGDWKRAFGDKTWPGLGPGGRESAKGKP